MVTGHGVVGGTAGVGATVETAAAKKAAAKAGPGGGGDGGGDVKGVEAATRRPSGARLLRPPRPRGTPGSRRAAKLWIATKTSRCTRGFRPRRAPLHWPKPAFSKAM